MIPEIVKRTISQAIKLLDASGCKYKIIDQDGNEFGDLVVAIKNFDFEPRALQGAITAWATEHWGKGSYKTCLVGPDVEILRCH